MKRILIFVILFVSIFYTGCTNFCIHVESDWIISENPTCQLAGKKYIKCEKCEKVLKEETIEKLSHSVSVYDELVSPTCSELGYKKGKCDLCDEIVTIELDKLEHSLILHNGKDATCTKSGYLDYYTCENCDYTTYEEIASSGHISSNWIIQEDSTCLSEGVKYKECITCHIKLEEDKIEKKEHSYSSEYEYNENIHYVKCECGSYISEKHIFNDGVIIKDATDYEEGIIKFTCDKCGYQKEEIISKTHYNTLTICGYNTLDKVNGYNKNEGIRLYDEVDSNVILSWHKVALTIDNGNYYVNEVVRSGENISKDYDYLLISYNNDLFTNLDINVGDVIKFSSDITNLTKGSINLTFEIANNSFTVSYYLGYDIFETKADLYKAFFTDFYYFIQTIDNNKLLEYNINNCEDFLSFCMDWNANEGSAFTGVGNALCSYYINNEENGTFASQPTTSFIGYCYHNNKYVDFLEFLEIFFAYWRTDEGYSKTDIHGNDFFYSSWASLVDTCKFFYFSSSTLTDKYPWFTKERSPRVHYALDNVPQVAKVKLETGKLTETITLPEIDLMYYTHLGWYDDPILGNKVTQVSESMTVYARFERKTHEITFHDGQNKVYIYVDEGKRVSNIPTPVNDFYNFACWTTIDFEKFDFLNAITCDLDLYSYWSNENSSDAITLDGYNTQSKTSVCDTYMGLRIYDANTSIGSSLYWLKIAIKNIDDSYVISSIRKSGESMPTDYDYIILVYASDSTGKYKLLSDMDLNVGMKVTFSEDITNLKAGEICVTVNFINNKLYNLILIDDSEFYYEPYYISGQITNLPVLTKDDYIFLGWCENITLDDFPISRIDNETYKDLVLYAKWEKDNGNILSNVSDFVKSDTIDTLPEKYQNYDITWLSENPNLYTINNNCGYTNRYYQTHEVQTVKVEAILNNGSEEIYLSKIIQISPIIFDEMTNPKAVYVAESSLTSYMNNSTRYLSSKELFSDKFKANFDMAYYAFANPNSDGSLTINTKYLNKVLALRSEGIRVLIVINGAVKESLQAMVKLSNDDTTRKIFVNNILDLVLSYNFDGVDIDWEFPGTSGLDGFTTDIDKVNLNKLLRDLRKGLDNIQDERGTNYVLSTAIPSTSWGSKRYDFIGDDVLGGINTYCDYVNMMSYDLNNGSYTTHLSPCYSSSAANDYKFGCVYGTIRFTELGLDKEKIILGCAAYGKSYKITEAVDSTKENIALGLKGTLIKLENVIGSYSSGTLYYSGVYNLLNDSNYQNYTEYSNGKVVGSYLYNKTNNIFITYDSVLAIKEKCNYALENGLGIMIWAYGEDATDTIVNTICDNLK